MRVTRTRTGEVAAPAPRPVGGRPALIAVLAGLTMIGPFTIDAIFPAFAAMQVDLHVDAVAMQQTLSVYLFSYAFASLFHGPISDAVGRRSVILIGALLYALTCVVCALAPSMPVLLAGRVAQGLVAGAGMIVGRTVIRDLYEGALAQRFMAHVSMIFAAVAASPEAPRELRRGSSIRLV